MSLRFLQVSAGYGRSQVLTGVTLNLAPGTLTGLIGPNGAGKTTMLRVGAGLIAPVAGRVIRDESVMYFGGEITLPGRCRAHRWTGLFGTASSIPTRMGRLSRGMRQLVALEALLSDCSWRVGLLDEPWEGLDPKGAQWLAGALERHRDRGAAVLVSSHRLYDVAGVCSSFAFLAGGTLRTLEPAGKPVDAGELARAFHMFAGEQ
jgi:ABC-2 type transport system ATP-binding protein